jgi:hypothetical protein
MAHGITDQDTVMSVRRTPWHRLGVALAERPRTLTAALEASGTRHLGRANRSPDAAAPRCGERGGLRAARRHRRSPVVRSPNPGCTSNFGTCVTSSPSPRS